MKAIILIGAAVVLLLTVSASAADLGICSVAPSRFAWMGCYAGGQAGGGFGQKDLSDNAGFLAALGGPSSADLDSSGYVLGAKRTARTWR